MMNKYVIFLRKHNMYVESYSEEPNLYNAEKVIWCTPFKEDALQFTSKEEAQKKCAFLNSSENVFEVVEI